jgi:hypothetical protein
MLIIIPMLLLLQVMRMIMPMTGERSCEITC